MNSLKLIISRISVFFVIISCLVLLIGEISERHDTVRVAECESEDMLKDPNDVLTFQKNPKFSVDYSSRARIMLCGSEEDEIRSLGTQVRFLDEQNQVFSFTSSPQEMSSIVELSPKLLNDESLSEQLFCVSMESSEVLEPSSYTYDGDGSLIKNLRVVSILSDVRSLKCSFGILFLFFVTILFGIFTIYKNSENLSLLQVNWKFYDAIFAFLGAVILPTVLLFGFGAIYNFSSTVLLISWEETVFGSIFSFGAFFFLAYGIASLRSHRPFLALGLGVKSSFPLWISAVLGVMLAVLGSVILLFFTPEEMSHMMLFSLIPTSVLFSVYFALLAPISEELLFRGLIQTSLLSVWSPKNVEGLTQSKKFIYALPAIIVSASLFVLLHVPQHIGFFYPLIPIALVSFSNGFLRYFSRSLLHPIVLHLAYNTTLILPSLFML